MLKGMIEMNHFYIFEFKRKQRLQLLLGFLILGMIMLVIFYFLSSNNSPTEETALIKGNEQEKNIALTFNISWGDEKVHDILNVLKKHEVRATFFVSGEWAERHPHIIDAITENKHELGMLGYRYKNYLEQDIEQVRKDMMYARNVFSKLGYNDLHYIRPPSGLFNQEIIELAERIGLDVIHWSINTNDWENPGVEAIVTEAKKVNNGDIILFHASDIAKQTAEALESVLPFYKEKGFSFVTITQLKEGITSEEKIIE